MSEIRWKHNRLEQDCKKPTPTQIEVGELVPNVVDGSLWTKDSNGVVMKVGINTGRDIPLDTKHFTRELSGSDDTVQKAMDTLDNVFSVPHTLGNKGMSMTTKGRNERDAEWSPVSTNPNVLVADLVIQDGVSATVASGFKIASGVTLTIPTDSVLSVN